MTAPTKRASVSEIARMLAERRTVAATPGVTIKMVKQGELQFEVQTTPDTTRQVLLAMTDDALAAAEVILARSNGGGQ